MSNKNLTGRYVTVQYKDVGRIDGICVYHSINPKEKGDLKHLITVFFPIDKSLDNRVCYDQIIEVGDYVSIPEYAS